MERWNINGLTHSGLIDPGRLHRILCAQAAHPSTAGTAPKPRVVDLNRGYQPLTSIRERAGQVEWPRATVRPVPGLAGHEITWCATLWQAYGEPLREHGLKVARSTNDRAEAFEWALGEVEKRRPKVRLAETPC